MSQSSLVSALVFALEDALAAYIHNLLFWENKKGDFIKFWPETKLQRVNLLRSMTAIPKGHANNSNSKGEEKTVKGKDEV